MCQKALAASLQLGCPLRLPSVRSGPGWARRPCVTSLKTAETACNRYDRSLLSVLRFPCPAGLSPAVVQLVETESMDAGTAPLDVRKAKESQVVAAFHVLAQDALSKARSDGLVTSEYLASSTEDELQVLGPSCKLPINTSDLQLTHSTVTLFFAALSNVTDPPTVNVPSSPTNPDFTLSVTTCPSNVGSATAAKSTII